MTRGIVHGLLIVGGVRPVAGATRQAPPQAGLSAAALNATKIGQLHVLRTSRARFRRATSCMNGTDGENSGGQKAKGNPDLSTCGI